MDEILGLVLDSIDYKEKSKIVYLYTKHGHDSVKVNQAKSMKSGFQGFTLTLNEVSYLKTNAKFPTLMEYNVITSNYDLVEDFENISLIYAFIKVVKNIPNDCDHSKTYDFVSSMLQGFRKNPTKKVLSIFLIKMLYVFGVNPELRRCMSCGSSEVVSFEVNLGGALCIVCSNPKSSGLYPIWKEYYYDKKEIEAYSDTDFVSLLEQIYKYYDRHVHLNLRFNQQNRK